MGLASKRRWILYDNMAY